MSTESFTGGLTCGQARSMKGDLPRLLQSDEVVADFINFLARLSLSEPIAYSWGPPIATIRRYCTRLGRGGWWDGYVNMYKEEKIVALGVHSDGIET